MCGLTVEAARVARRSRREGEGGVGCHREFLARRKDRVADDDGAAAAAAGSHRDLEVAALAGEDRTKVELRGEAAVDDGDVVDTERGSDLRAAGRGRLVIEPETQVKDAVGGVASVGERALVGERGGERLCERGRRCEERVDKGGDE